MTASLATLPDVTRPEAGIALVTPLYVGSPARQRAAVKSATLLYEASPLPEGFVSFSAFASTDGENVLTYAQWTSDDAYRVQGGGTNRIDTDTAEPVRYRLYRSRILEPNSVPKTLVAPVFDVDGPGRQRRAADVLLDGPLSKPFPGLVACHFHLSTDGTRVLNWAEWVDEEAHDAFGASELPHECLQALTMPGVRGIGGKRYTLQKSVVRPD
jgi:methylaspartate ammonia-lyase